MPSTRVISCPICGDSMAVETRSDIEVDSCENHGVWLDQSELLKITENERRNDEWSWEDLFLRRVYPPIDRERTLPCPLTGEPMRLEKYEDVIIDWSPGNGIWLDTRELESILNNLRTEPMYMRGMALRLSVERY